MNIKKTLMGLVVVGAFALSSAAFALPSLGTVLDGSSYDTPLANSVMDSGAESAFLTDTSGKFDSALSTLFFEGAGFKANNTFGIYDFSITGGTVILGDMLQVFDGAANEGASSTVQFDLVAGTAQSAFGTKNIGDTFGFYLRNTVDRSGGTFYSHTSLNADGLDHSVLYDTSVNAVGFTLNNLLASADIVLGFEDLYGGGDRDYDDMVIGVNDVSIPEPSILALMGLGLLGAGFAGRRKKTA